MPRCSESAKGQRKMEGSLDGFSNNAAQRIGSGKPICNVYYSPQCCQGFVAEIRDPLKKFLVWSE